MLIPPSPCTGSTRIGGRLVVDRRGCRGEVVVGHVDEAGHHGLEAGMILGLGGGGERGEGAAVKAPFHRHDFEPPGLAAVGAGQLDGGLVGLGAAVAEEALRPEGSLGELLRQSALGLHVPGVGHVNEPADLFANGRDNALGAMAQQVAAPAGKEVEITVSLGVPHRGALAANQADGEPSIVGYHVTIELADCLSGARKGWWRLRQRSDSNSVEQQNKNEARSTRDENHGLSRTGRCKNSGVSVIAADDLGAGAALREDFEKQASGAVCRR